MTRLKHTTKHIYWHENGGQVFLLVGYCPTTLDCYDLLFREAKKDFPALKKSECHCGRVTRSNTVDGHTVLTFWLSGPKKKYPNYGNRAGFPDFQHSAN